MRQNFDPLIGLYIDDENCQACTYWDCCSRMYADCNKKRGWQFAMSTWQALKEEDVEDVSNIGC
jgi:hypothetical protein